ncbi:Predicted hydrolase of alkaline phosphatase superfamily [Enterobacter asburiae]|uniref:Predicted hydrolase of alkaline phosphatase superfamily n=1 Tax=Enterobacter asburiae TaxID=61645 RepID=A0A376FMB8_ENTAS|nr:Predicted hydrolase of alkaline phosphatase superfamily [Enterobacter asburiae]
MVTNRQRYREKVSQMVSWGHWFALFNILLATVIGCRYLFVADWPTTLTGRIYSWMSVVGHFSFLVFATYLLILFPLDVYRHVAASDAVLVRHSCDGGDDAAAYRQ